ncbi:uncharacterized protein LOC122510127 isoform X2 [Leptopilina heterotoma]|uniref:uncharacterized protein LOC122510127 isoform X2 n=1 Tax=Leptopilina heterotoma TaxID=63436 RepID=UPI001CA818D6|nr:uncharacterized protein LOC122510127 isoform X2 [Leptopilina heterotoma]
MFSQKKLKNQLTAARVRKHRILKKIFEKINAVPNGNLEDETDNESTLSNTVPDNEEFTLAEIIGETSYNIPC